MRFQFEAVPDPEPPVPDPEPPVPDPEPPVPDPDYLVNAVAGAGGSINPPSQTVSHGQSATFTLSPSAGFQIESVSGCDGLLSDNIYVTGAITEACVVSAEFAIRTYALSYTAGPNGSIVGATAQIVEHGSDGTEVRADPDSGFGLVSWSDGMTANPRTDSNVTAPIHVSASFGALRAIGGEVSGLAANGLVLQLNGQDDLAIGANGGFQFAQRVPEGLSYQVAVSQQPDQQVCTVMPDNAQLVGDADILDVEVECVTAPGTITHRLGGEVTGLAGSGLVLFNNGGDSLAISANGPFEFDPVYVVGTTYEISVGEQPVGQTCSITESTATGTLDADVDEVAVSCVTNPGVHLRDVGGTLSGLVEGEVELSLNDRFGQLTLAANDSYAFAEGLTEGSSYAVSVVTQPEGQLCHVDNGEGTLGAFDVTAVEVDCQMLDGFFVVSATAGANGALVGSTQRVVANNGSAQFELLSDAGYSPVAPSGDCPSGSFEGNVWTTGPITGACSLEFGFDVTRYTVTALVEGDGGTVDPASQEVVEQGHAEVEVFLSPGYELGSISGCGGGGQWVSGSIWRTGPIVEECAVRFQFEAVPDPEPPVPDPEPPVPDPEPPIIDDGVAYCAIGCEEGVSATGARTVAFEFEDPDMGTQVRLEAVLPDSDGKPLRHRVYRTLLHGAETVTEAVSEVSGSTVTLERDGDGQPQIVTRSVLGDGVILEARAGADGSAEHRVLTEAGETVAGTDVAGALTRFTAEGRVTTSLEFASGQNRFRAMVWTEKDGRGRTGFKRWDDLTEEWVLYSRTIDESLSLFEVGHRVWIERTGWDGMQLDIQTRVIRDLYF